MISSRRFATFLAVAAGATGLGASTASAAAAAEPLVHPQSISVADTLDDVSTAAVPAQDRAQLPTLTEQLQAGTQQAGQIHQLTDMAAPVAGLLPAVE